MEKNEWIKVADEADLVEGVPLTVEVGEDSILLFKRGADLCGCGNSCPHFGAPLAEGVFSDGTVTCPWHAARFDLWSGKMLSPPALDDLPTYDAKIEDGAVFIRRAEEEESPEVVIDDDRSFLIIGAGAAGSAAAEALRREGFSGTIKMITHEPEAPYDRTLLSKGLLSGEAKPEWLPLRRKGFYDKAKIELLTETRVTGFDAKTRTVTFDDGSTITGDAVLIATGSTPKKLSVPGLEGEGVFYLRSAADANKLVSAAENAKTAVVLGASFIGMEAAAALRSRGMEVHIVDPVPVPFNPVLGPAVGGRLRKMHEDAGEHFHLSCSAKEVRRSADRLHIELSDGAGIDADMIVVGVGVAPTVGPFEDCGIVENGVIPVDERLQTPVEGVFAAGDVAQFPYVVSKDRIRIEHWAVAQRQGIHAAQSMLGGDEPFAQMLFFWTRQHETSTMYTGYAADWDEVVVRGDVENGDFLAGYVKNGSVTAACSIGMGNELIAVGTLLALGETVSAEEITDKSLSFIDRLEQQP